jgi:hypothetical protein
VNPWTDAENSSTTASVTPMTMYSRKPPFRLPLRIAVGALATEPHFVRALRL